MQRNSSRFSVMMFVSLLLAFFLTGFSQWSIAVDVGQLKTVGKVARLSVISLAVVTWPYGMKSFEGTNSCLPRHLIAL